MSATSAALCASVLASLVATSRAGGIAGGALVADGTPGVALVSACAQTGASATNAADEIKAARTPGDENMTAIP
jgi:hypothetical protein